MNHFLGSLVDPAGMSGPFVNRKLAICDIYGVKPVVLSTASDLRRYEQDLCQQFGLAYKGVGDAILASEKRSMPLKWQCHVVYDCTDKVKSKQNKSRVLSFPPPIVDDAMCLYSSDQSFPFDRLLFVHITGLHVLASIRSFFREGICFAGVKYAFLGGEVDKSTVMAWFYADDPLHTIQDARNWLGNLEEQPSGKGNARLKLGFSPIFDQLQVLEANVLVIPDIQHEEKLLTDGCGYIASTLAQRIPYGVHQGRSVSVRCADMPTPAIIQVRCASRLGLFKGCLLVTADTNLCPADSVVFRESMKKTEPNNRKVYPVACVLGVVSTFEHPEVLQRSKEGREFHIGDHAVRLNRNFCLLMHALGVPETYFQQLMRTEINRLMEALVSRSSAYTLMRHALRFSIDAEQSDTEEEDSEEVAAETDNDEASLATAVVGCPPVSAVNRTIAAQVCDFLVNGHELSEPCLRSLLINLLLKKVKMLQKCQLSVQRSLYLVGAPDMYGELEPDEVFISFPIDRTEGDGELKMNRGYFVGSVMVTRQPMYHLTDIRKFNAVFCPSLADQLAHTSGGVIFFSTKGSRAPADMMSGGDYDGDQFIIICDDSADLMKLTVMPFPEKLEPASNTSPMSVASPTRMGLFSPTSYNRVTPISPRSPMSPVTPTTPMQIKPPVFDEAAVAPAPARTYDHRGGTILEALLLSAEKRLVGQYSTAWVCWADRNGPSCHEAFECGTLSNIALDAPKTGKKVTEIKSLLQIECPYYLKADNKIDSISTADTKTMLHTLYDMAVRGYTGATAPGEIVIDFDMFYVLGHESWNPDALLLANDLDGQCTGYMKMDADNAATFFFQQFTAYQKGLVDWKVIVERYWRSVVAICQNGKEPHDQRALFAALREEHKKLFVDEAHTFAVLHGIADSIASCRLAGFVYFATYFHALKKPNVLPYCWEVAGGYLHENKRMRVLQQANQPLTDALPRKELRHLL